MGMPAFLLSDCVILENSELKLIISIANYFLFDTMFTKKKDLEF